LSFVSTSSVGRVVFISILFLLPYSLRYYDFYWVTREST
jgi:hypothetical protein